ncbi:MAG: porin family protein [Microscillaceae bacterium]|nr:porin family protein [Microscillaceae bacterium]
MKKTILLLCLCFGSIALPLSTQAQFKLGVELGLALPFDDFSDFVETGYGFRVKGLYFLNEHLGLGLTTGFYSFGVEGDRDDDEGFRQVPLTFDVMYQFSGNKAKPYVSGGLGIHFTSFRNENITFDTGDELALNLGGGVLFAVADKIDIGGDLRFHIVEDISFMGLSFKALFSF